MKTAAEKMFIKPGRLLRMWNAPENAGTLLGGLPPDVETHNASAPVDILLIFVHHRADLERLLPDAPGALAAGGAIWVLYHKGTSKTRTDVHRDSINQYAQSLGLVGVAMVSIDDDWSALRLKRAV